MYIIKNAWKNIKETKGKNLLIGIIIFIIGLSCTLALSIKEAANTAYQEGLDNISVTASINYDRSTMMQQSAPSSDSSSSSSSSKSDMRQAMIGSSLSLSELEKYATASSVKDFYYTSTLSMNAKSVDAIENSNSANMPQRQGDSSINSGDFTLVGYSSYDAMSAFTSETSKISSGTLFNIDSTNECIISSDLATYNSLKVGDYITLVNPNNTSETYKLKITGIYKSTSSSTTQMGMGMGMSDPANQILTSTKTVSAISKASAAITKNKTNSTTLTGMINGTYTFKDVASYEKFQKQVSKMGLSDSYVVESMDLQNYENSLTPLNNLSDYANTFLIVILLVGGTILVVFNILRVKERKYEIGVLSAIGMNKKKISLQFISELGIITLMSLILSIGVGAAASVPVTNTLLANTSTSSSDVMNAQMPGGGPGSNDSGSSSSSSSSSSSTTNKVAKRGTSTNYIKSVSSATDMNVILELLGIGLVMVVVSGGIATLTILRYEPLKILSNQD